MGCAPSGCVDDDEKNTGLRLMTSKLHFRPEQLDKLNDYFSNLAKTDLEVSSEISKIEATVERLVQRLIAGVGNLDARFAAAFLVSLNERRRVKQLRFEYLLRLDALSTPSGNTDTELSLSLEEDVGVPGFARLRLKSGDAGSWAEFIGPDGRLRRDLIKARVAALLAASTRKDSANGVDERLCITPGQVVDPEVLDKIFKQPDHCRVFFGPATAESKLAEIGSHRIAIVEDEAGIILKIGLNGSKSQDIEVRLLIGLSINAWPNGLDYPKRIPLYHCDTLLHYTAAQSGMYAIASAPHQGLRCDDRATLWRVRVPAAELILREHYSDESVPALTESALSQILDQLRGRRSSDFTLKRKGTMKLVSRHMARCIHSWSLERLGPEPLRNWAPDQLSHHVLLELDELLRALRCQNLRCYFQPRCNLMLQCAKGSSLYHEDAYASDARLLESYLQTIHAYSAEWLHVTQQLPRRTLTSSELLEQELQNKWRQVMASLPRGTMSGHYGYGSRQLQYLALLVGEVLSARESLHRGYSFDACSTFFNLSIADSQSSSESIESLVYLMSLVLRQAKDQIYATSYGQRRDQSDRKKRKRARRATKAQRKQSCAKAYYERSVDLLIDVVRKDRDTAYLDLDNHLVMAKTLLKWLYFGMEEDKKVLGPLLRPYLNNLFNASHENAWHVESWKRRHDAYAAEMRSLGLFCKLVTSREMLPASGIVESLSRGWSWADNVATMIERSAKGDGGLKLCFLTRERILRYQLKFADDKGPGSYSTWIKARSVGSAVRRASVARLAMITATDTLPRLSAAATAAGENDLAACKGVTTAASHIELRDTSPLTFVCRLQRRRGRQRGPGGFIPALVSLNKFRVLQEVAQVLPQDERTAMLELVQRVSREAARRLRRASCPDPAAIDAAHRQVYKPRSESKLYEEPSTSRGAAVSVAKRIDEGEHSPKARQQRIILERQQQLQREILEIHDTLTRGLRSRSQLPTSWDTTSMTSSTWGSQPGSIGRGRLKRHHTSVWDTFRGTSPLWDSVSCSSTFIKVKPEELASRNNEPEQRRQHSKSEHSNNGDDLPADKLPSWDVLERALHNKFLSYEYAKPNSVDESKDVDVDYLVVGNDTRRVSAKSK